MCKQVALRILRCVTWSAVLALGALGSGCKEGSVSAVLRNLSSSNLYVQIAFLPMEGSEYQAQSCPLVSFRLLPNDTVGTEQAVGKGREILANEYRYDLKQCVVTLDLPTGHSLETGWLDRGEAMTRAKSILIRSTDKSVTFLKLDFGFRKIDPKQELYVWDYGWGS